jgi:CubicO group peptidase (beta-lactamase class C family)
MTLADEGKFQLDDPVKQYIPEFRGGSRDDICVRDLLTHTSGLPDQLPENESLRRSHATLTEFTQRATQTPLLFQPGSKYSYSSMGILLATEIAQRISGTECSELVDQRVFQPLGMKHSALGLGSFKLAETVRCQVEDAAPESGGGESSTNDWDWNSEYWRHLGSPWGGAHGSAADVATFLGEFLHPSGKIVRTETAASMIANHNPPHLTPRGLGFTIGRNFASPACSEQTFGHSGATGTLAWADPATNTIFVVLTTLPAGAAKPHPRKLVSDQVAKAVLS